MKKQALLALMLALALVLTGCTLVQKDAEVDAATEIIRMGDRVVTKGEFQQQVNYQLNYMSYLYSMYGYSYDPTSEAAVSDAREAVLNSLKADLVSRAKVEELGLDQLTEEEQKSIQEKAEENYQSNLDYILSTDYADSDLPDEEKTEKAREQLERNGYNMDKALADAKDNVLEEKLRAEIIKDVTVSDDEIQAEYDSKVSSAKETYLSNAGGWATAANQGSSTLYYTPAGVRYVKQILVKFTDEDQAKIDEANKKTSDAQAKVTAAESKQTDAQAVLDAEDSTDEAKEAAKADLEAAQAELTAAQAEAETAQKEADAVLETAFANIDEAADGILAELEGGADWDKLMAERTQDPGMQSGVTAERGYAVAADMTSFDPAFVQAAMALEKVGDTSGKIRGNSYGYYIIRYVGDAVEGPIAPEEVRDAIRQELLTSKQDDTYTETIQKWVDETEFKVDLNPLKD